MTLFLVIMQMRRMDISIRNSSKRQNPIQWSGVRLGIIISSSNHARLVTYHQHGMHPQHSEIPDDMYFEQTSNADKNNIIDEIKCVDSAFVPHLHLGNLWSTLPRNYIDSPAPYALLLPCPILGIPYKTLRPPPPHRSFCLFLGMRWSTANESSDNNHHHHHE